MYRRIFRSICVVALSAVLVAAALILGVVYRHLKDQAIQSLTEEAHAVAEMMEDWTEGDSVPVLLSSDTRLTIIAPDGTVLYDSHTSEKEMEDHSSREEVRQALSTGTGSAERTSATTGSGTYYYAIRLRSGNVLRMSTDYLNVMALLGSVLGPVTAIAIAAVGLSAMLAMGLSRAIVEPLNNLDLDHPERPGVYEELQPLLQRLVRQRRTISEQLVQANQQKEEFRLITENMSEGFLVVDSATHLLTYNGAALQMLGLPTPRPGDSVLYLNRSEDFRQMVERALAGEHSSCTIQDDSRSYQMMANPATQGDSVIGAVIVILDVTEQIERERLRREFTANVSHELKTPLTSISGFAELMKSGTVAAADVVDFSTTIYDEAQRLIVLVNDIIKLSELDEGEQQYEWEEVDLYDLSDEILHRLAPAAERNNVTLRLTGGSACVKGVPKILDEMVFNLCDNAIKYNKKGGSVEVGVLHTVSGVRLSVRDTGIGIPPAHQSRVFERFYRVDKSHSKEIGGTGLGLSIVKHGAMYHGAELSLESAVDRGTTVTLYFRSKPRDFHTAKEEKSL